MAYRDDEAAREARIDVVRAEITALETELARGVESRGSIDAAARVSRFGGLAELRRPWALFIIVLAIGAGVYVGSAVHVVKHVVGGPCG